VANFGFATLEVTTGNADVAIVIACDDRRFAEGPREHARPVVHAKGAGHAEHGNDEGRYPAQEVIF
jgi:hypothetical protein